MKKWKAAPNLPFAMSWCSWRQFRRRSLLWFLLDNGKPNVPHFRKFVAQVCGNQALVSWVKSVIKSSSHENGTSMRWNQIALTMSSKSETTGRILIQLILGSIPMNIWQVCKQLLNLSIHHKTYTISYQARKTIRQSIRRIRTLWISSPVCHHFIRYPWVFARLRLYFYGTS